MLFRSNEIYEVENIDEINNKLKQDLKFIESKMLLLSNKMSEIRKEKSEKLSKSINLELTDLEMKNARFNIKVEFDSKNQFNKNGLDEVEFLICTNIGEEEKSLIKIASGGEMSRIMLAIKSVLSEVDKIPSLIFDEIDIGISGIAAKAVGSKMKKISQNHQILCITHLANIAAQGTHNYYISKEVEDNKTKTKIEKLDEQSTIKEIARIASGDINDVSIEHAKQLMRII